MRALVTGATGFIGKHLVDALASAGHQVDCLTRGAAPSDARAGVTFHHADFDKADLGLPTRFGEGFDAVFHLGGATRAVSPEAFRRANVDATERLLDLIVTNASGARFVYVSSQAAAGPARDAKQVRRESDPDAPIEGYGKSKLAAERAVRSRAGAIGVTVLRPVAVYGPGDRDFLSAFSMIKRGLAVYPGTRHSSINTVFVADLVPGIIAAATAPAAVGQTYFLGDDAPRSWQEIYSTIGDVVGQRPLELGIPHAVVSAAGAIGDLVGTLTGKPPLISSNKAVLAAPRYWLCSSERARNDFGFATPTSLRDGLARTYDWYVGHHWL
jgi:nucleoside-diphosphate-sugar epimerase